jgi:hypothetical protein
MAVLVMYTELFMLIAACLLNSKIERLNVLRLVFPELEQDEIQSIKNGKLVVSTP